MMKPLKNYSDAELKKFGTTELGALMGTGLYHGDSYRKLAWFYAQAKIENRKYKR